MNGARNVKTPVYVCSFFLVELPDISGKERIAGYRILKSNTKLPEQIFESSSLAVYPDGCPPNIDTKPAHEPEALKFNRARTNG